MKVLELGEEGSVALHHLYAHGFGKRFRGMPSAQVREMIPQRFGSNYLPEKPKLLPNPRKTPRKLTKAVRPTDAMRRAGRCT